MGGGGGAPPGMGGGGGAPPGMGGGGGGAAPPGSGGGAKGAPGSGGGASGGGASAAPGSGGGASGGGAKGAPGSGGGASAAPGSGGGASGGGASGGGGGGAAPGGGGGGGGAAGMRTLRLSPRALSKSGPAPLGDACGELTLKPEPPPDSALPMSPRSLRAPSPTVGLAAFSSTILPLATRVSECSMVIHEGSSSALTFAIDLRPRRRCGTAAGSTAEILMRSAPRTSSGVSSAPPPSSFDLSFGFDLIAESGVGGSLPLSTASSEQSRSKASSWI